MRHPVDAQPTQLRIDAAIARLGVSQHGVFSRAQVLRVGGTRGIIEHRLRTGRWEPASQGIYRLAGAPRSWRQDLIAACLAWGAGAVVSHRAAAVLWKFLGFSAMLVELTVPRTRRRAAPGLIHRYPLGRRDVTTVDGIPVTTPARTLIDLATVCSIDALEEVLDDALLRGVVTLPGLRRCFASVARQGGPGTAKGRRLLEARDPSTPGPESVFERRLLRLLRSSGLPDPRLQYQIRNGRRLIATVDFAYPDVRVAIEADGRRWHSSRRRFIRDRARGNQLTAMGWRVLHATWSDLAQSGTLIGAIKRALSDAP